MNQTRNQREVMKPILADSVKRARGLLGGIGYLCAIALLTGCEVRVDSRPSGQAEARRAEPEPLPYAKTHQYDGHWFISYGYDRPAIVHHPDCPKCEGRGGP